MGGLNGVEMVSALLFWAVCAMAGALILMQKIETICRYEKQYGLPEKHANWIGAIVGGLSGAGVAGIGIYYYLFSPKASGWVEWTGRFSYVLILAASAAHVMILIHLWLRLNAEDRALIGDKAVTGTLSRLRKQHIHAVGQHRDRYADLKARDEDAIEELMGVFGERMLSGLRALSRIPFYGYLGTVCGILMMSEELTQLNEATESFKVLRDMASGLVLAFQTTLIALLAYLPLRKMYDALINRMGELERKWLAMRDDALDGRQN
jgi:biopolymer transport protein ExbB/TolQ